MELNEKIMQLAAMLGDAIKETEEIKRLNAAEAAYKEAPELQQKVTEYNVQTLAMTEEYKKADKDLEVINAIEARINTLYQEITELPVMKEYTAAQEAVNELMQKVNNEIQFRITGEKPSECTHDCSTCGGCR